MSLGEKSPHIFSKFKPLNTDTVYGPLRVIDGEGVISIMTRFRLNNIPGNQIYSWTSMLKDLNAI